MDGASRRRAIAHDLTVSLTAAAISAGAAKLLTTVAPATFSGSVPAWLVIAGLTITGIASFLLGRRLRHRSRQAIVVISAPTRTRWLADLVEHLATTLDRHGIDLVIKYAPYDHNGRNQLLPLARLGRTRSDVQGCFIIAAQPEQVLPELRNFCSSARYPIVFLDVLPFSGQHALPTRSAFVGCDAADIGRRAARWVANDLRRRGISAPHVLVVGGSGQNARHQEFETSLRQLAPAATIDVDLSGQFSRGRSREIAGTYLQERLRRDATINAIFCTNDEMALGVLDAVQMQITAGCDFSDLSIVGVDGIAEAVATINAQHTQFRATIVQDAGRIAESGVDALLRMRGGAASPGAVLIPSEAYPVG